MVKLTQITLLSKKRTFLDKMRVYVQGGPGGQGFSKFGGKGGRGGNVYVVANPTATLKSTQMSNPSKRYKASIGANSRVRALLGHPGEDTEIPVPLGVLVRSDAGRVIGELNEPDDRVLVAQGGEGGSASNNFKGQKGDAHSMTLDLKLIADIGLVGFPNAGKSTLLSAISRASPKIAAYPFTTIQPQLGTMVFNDHRRISVADLPGLIEGAHSNVGMGHNFLKHVERTNMLLFLVDIHGFQLSPKYPHRTAFETILLLMRELELYKEDLKHKPALLALNKSDIPGSDEMLSPLLAQLNDIQGAASCLDKSMQPDHIIHFDDIITISAKNRQGTDKLKHRLRTLLDLYADMDYEQSMKTTTDKISLSLNEQFGGSQLV